MTLKMRVGEQGPEGSTSTDAKVVLNNKPEDEGSSPQWRDRDVLPYSTS